MPLSNKETGNESGMTKLDNLQGTRYSIQQLKPHLEPFIDIAKPTVTLYLANQIRKLLDGKHTDILTWRDGREGKLIPLQNKSGVSLHLMSVRVQIDIKDQYMGYIFTAQDKDHLRLFGDLPRPVMLRHPNTGELFKGLLGIDRKSNKFQALRLDNYPIPDVFHQVRLTEQQKQLLLEGKAIRLTNMLDKNSKPFSAYVRLSASAKGFSYEFIKPKKEVSQDQTAKKSQKKKILPTKQRQVFNPQKLQIRR